MRIARKQGRRTSLFPEPAGVENRATSMMSMPAEMPPPFLATPSLPGLRSLVPGTLLALGLAGLGGWSMASTPLLGGLVLLAATLWLLHRLRSLHRRTLTVIDQSTAALRQLGRGENGFRLDAQGLHEFDALLLAIDDLREAIEPAVLEQQPRRGGLPQRRPPSVPPQATMAFEG